MTTAVRYAIPSLVTALSLLLGFGALLSATIGALEFAGWLVVWCVLLDVVDGALARLLKAVSRFGAEFDSLADLVAFGVAPAMLAFQVAHQVTGFEPGRAGSWLLVMAAGGYALAAAIRLARFNSTPDTAPRGWFAGLPTTLAGLILATSLMLLERAGPQAVQAWAPYLPVLLLATAVAMVSRLPIPGIRRRSNRWLDALQWVNVAAVYVCGILRIAPEYLLAFAVAYLIVGAAAGLARRRPGAGNPAKQ